MHRFCLSALIVFLGVLAGSLGAVGESIAIHVPGQAPVDLPTVVGVRYDCGKETSSGAPVTKCFEAGGAVPRTSAQFVPDLDAAGKALRRGTLWMPITFKTDQRGKTLEIALAPATPGPRPPVVLKEVPDQATDFIDGGRMVMRYNHGPKGLDGKADPDAVVGFVHPILGLDGEAFSQNSPKDHIHHRGLFWAWPRLKRGGVEIRGDWWARQDFRYRLGRVWRRESGPVLATMTVEGYWDYQRPEMAGPERIVREVATLRLFSDAFTKAADYQVLDVDVDLYAMVGDLTMAGRDTLEKGYGGFTLRLPAPKPGRITADGQEIKKDQNMYRARWADYSGAFPGATRGGQSGAAIFTPPTHPGFPPPWCLRYYGPQNVSYPGLEFVPLHRDRPLHLSYRVILHRGDVRQARLADLYMLYATDWAGAPSSRPGE